MKSAFNQSDWYVSASKERNEYQRKQIERQNDAYRLESERAQKKRGRPRKSESQ